MIALIGDATANLRGSMLLGVGIWMFVEIWRAQR